MEMNPIRSDKPSSAAVGDTRHIKYVFVDIVEFSTGRSVEAQNEIVEVLNSACTEVCRSLIAEGEVIYVPTGDGICVAIIDARATYDAHLIFATNLISRLQSHNDRVDTAQGSMGYMRRFAIRVGISENVDNIVRDINGNKNVAGNGVTIAQRVMSLGDGMQILANANAYQSLHAHEQYIHAFRHFKAVVKHGTSLDVYQLVQPENSALNSDIPSAFQNREPIEDEYEACLREKPSTSGQVQCIREATESWESEVDARVSALMGRLAADEKPLLEKAQRAWTRYRNAELQFSDAFYSKMQGTMWRPIRASRPHALLRERGRDLVTYLELIGDESDEPALGQV